MTTLILSPHLDDALFSMSNFLVNTYCDILLVTLFTKEQKHNLTNDYAIYANVAKRKIEDKNAISKVKKLNPHIRIEIKYLDLPDQIFRNRNVNINADIEKKLLEIKKTNKIITVYCPLGIGEHEDHVLTFKNCIKIFDLKNTLFYYDYPYCNLKLNLIKRFNTLKLTHNYNLEYKDIQEYYHDPIYRSCPTIVHYLRIIWKCLWYLFPSNKNKNIIYTSSPCEYDKYKVIKKYETQIKPIFGGLEFLKKYLHKFNKETYLKFYDV